MNYLVIDSRSRKVTTYTANVTKTGFGGLVIRQAMELPSIMFMASGHDWQNPLYIDLPVIIIGNGYQAQSSAGHVRILEGMRCRATSKTVVGILPYGGSFIRVNLQARLLPPCKLIKSEVFGNSNTSTAAAVFGGLKLLLQADPRALLIEEGQSDSCGVIRLLPLIDSKKYGRTEYFFETEHQPDEMFQTSAQAESEISESQDSFDGESVDFKDGTIEA